MAIYFETPTAPLVPAAVKPQHPGFELFKHYRNYDAGINLFVVDGAVTTVEPDYEFVTPDRVYLGGHLYTVTQAEADLLIAAGYSVYEGTPAVQDGPLPGFEDVSSSDSGVDEGLVMTGVGVGPLGTFSLGGQ